MSFRISYLTREVGTADLDSGLVEIIRRDFCLEDMFRDSDLLGSSHCVNIYKVTHQCHYSILNLYQENQLNISSSLINYLSPYSQSKFLLLLYLYFLIIMNTPHYKIVVLGQGRVGKTSISLKYVKNEFNDKTKETINASYLQKRVKLEDNQVVKLSIWDTAGQEQYNSVAPIYYKDALGAIIVYDITSRESFDKVKKWVNELEEHAQKGIVLMIAGNKADLENSRRVKKEEVEQYANSHSAEHFTVSAKNGMRVEEMFQRLAEKIHKGASSVKVSGKKGGPKLTVENEKKKESKEKKPCC